MAPAAPVLAGMPHCHPPTHHRNRLRCLERLAASPSGGGGQVGGGGGQVGSGGACWSVVALQVVARLGGRGSKHPSAGPTYQLCRVNEGVGCREAAWERGAAEGHQSWRRRGL